MHPLIPARLPGLISDEALTPLSEFFLSQISLVIDLDGALDRPRLALALRRLLDAEPVLGCHYVPRWIAPYWERIPDVELDRCELLEVADEGDREERSQEFLGRELPLNEGPHLRALLHRGGAGDRLLIVVQHRVGDAGGVKELGYRLAGIYRALGDDPDHRPAPRLGARSLLQVYRRFVPWHVPGLLAHAATEIRGFLRPWRSLQFTTGAWDGAAPRFALTHLDQARVAGLLGYGHARAATLNDLLLAALLRVTADVQQWDGRRPLRVLSTADLRRHLPGEHPGGLCNLSGFILIHVGRELGARFEDTLGHVLRATGRIKGPYLGLSWDLLGLALATWPAGLARAAFSRLLRTEIETGHMPLLLTNMGPIDDAALDRFGPPVRHAFLVCPPIRQGIYGAGVSGYRGTLTLSAGASSSAVPMETLRRVFTQIDHELPD